MQGNVPEWCQDAYDYRFYEQPAASERNPLNKAATPGDRVIRGGGWISTPDDCRCAARAAASGTVEAAVIGLRPAYYPLP